MHMSLVLPNLARGLFLAGLALAALPSADGQESSSQSRSGIRFTEPDNVVTGTNVAEITAKKPNLGALDQSLRKPFEFFKSEDFFGDAMPPVIRRAPPSAYNNKRAKELMDRKKNWVFSTPEEMYGIQSPEQMMNMREYGPDGEEKTPKTTFERYLERMEKNRTESATNQVKSDKLPGWLKPSDREGKLSSGTDDQTTSGSIFGTTEANSKRTSDSAPFDSPFGVGYGAPDKVRNDFFSPGSSDAEEKSVAKDAARATRMQEFKQFLETGSTISRGLGDGFGASAPGSPPVPAVGSPFSTGTFGRDTFGSQPATRPASPPPSSPAILPTFSAPAFSTPSLPPPSRIFTPPPPAFEQPKRKF